MEEIMYEFGGYWDDYEYAGWPSPAFGDERVPMELYGSAGNTMLLSAANNSLALDTNCSNLQEEDQNNIQAKISSHPFYPKLLLTYIDCHKVGAPPEIVNMLDNIAQENDLHKRSSSSSTALNRPISHDSELDDFMVGAPPEIVNMLDSVVQESDRHRRSSSSSTTLNRPISDDSELDDFMVTYCDVLAKFKSDLERSFNEATTFLNDIQTQLTNLCTTTNISGGAEGDTIEVYNEQQKNIINDKMCGSESEIKDKLMEKYSGHISRLKQNFCKKKKKAKFPKEATQILLNWWTTHYNWPYPTERDRICLAESTGLDPKQINNWFINQRKRHWKPSENM